MLLPIGRIQKAVRTLWIAMKIFIGFIDDKREVMVFCELIKCIQHRVRIFHARGIIRADQTNGFGFFCDQLVGQRCIGQQIGPRRQRRCLYPHHIEPHFMVEIPRHGQKHFIPSRAKRRDHRAKRLVAPRGNGNLAGAYLRIIGI